MRTLTLYRERALAGFALRYFCMLGRDRTKFIESLRQLEDPRANGTGDVALRNGERIKLEIDETETNIFAVVYLESRCIVTPSIPIPAGTEDLGFQLDTGFDQYLGMTVTVRPMEKTE